MPRGGGTRRYGVVLWAGILALTAALAVIGGLKELLTTRQQDEPVPVLLASIWRGKLTTASSTPIGRPARRVG